MTNITKTFTTEKQANAFADRWHRYLVGEYQVSETEYRVELVDVPNGLAKRITTT